MPTARHRTYAVPGHQGRARNLSLGWVTSSAQVSTGVMDDVVGNPYQMNAMDANSTSVVCAPINGGPVNNCVFENYPSTFAQGGNPLPNHLSSGFMDPMTAIRMMNPGEPLVDIPNFLFELKDFPRMLKHAEGRAKSLAKASKANIRSDVERYMRHPRNPAEDWLNYQFGWRPFINDLVSLSGLSKSIADKYAALQRSLNQGYASRHAELGTVSQQSTSTGVHLSFSSAPTIQGTRVATTTTHKWAAARFRANPAVYRHLTNNEAMGQLAKAALGLDVSLTHVWDVMPWSWLVGWFTDVSGIIHTRANRFGWSLVQACVCTHTSLITTSTPINTFGLSAGTDRRVAERKSRTLVSPSGLPTWRSNYLSAGQLTTLAALSSRGL